MKIRAATEADLPAITDIYNESVRRSTATMDTEPKSLDDRREWLAGHNAMHPVIVAELEGEIAGWGCLSPWSDRPAYAGTAETSVYVHAAMRGRGIGNALLAELVRIARVQRLHTLVARIATDNPASIRLHESAGFAHTGTMREVGYKLGRWVDVASFQLMLQA